jgi:hypothetical protein
MDQVAGQEFRYQARVSYLHSVRDKWKGFGVNFLDGFSNEKGSISIVLAKLDECSATSDQTRHSRTSEQIKWNGPEEIGGSCIHTSSMLRLHDKNANAVLAKEDSASQKSISKGRYLSISCSERPWIQSPRRMSQERRSSNLALEVCERLVDCTESPMYHPGQGLHDDEEISVCQPLSPSRRAISGNSGKHWLLLGPALVEAKLPSLSPHASPGEIGQRRSIFSCAGNPIFSSVSTISEKNSSQSPIARRYEIEPLNETAAWRRP